MTRQRKEAILATCASASDAVRGLESGAIAWSASRRFALPGYAQELRKHREVAQELPEEWHTATAAQVVMGALFADRAATARMLAEDRTLGPRARELADRALERPWAYALFSTTADLGDDLWECVDHGESAAFLLHSPSVTSLMREGARLFLSLIYSNGSCSQAFGPVHYFRGFSPADFAYLAGSIEPMLLEGHGLAAVIARRPAPFLLLARWTEIPPVAYRGSPLAVYYEERPQDAPPALASPDRFEVDVRGQLTRCRLQPPEPGAPDFFVEAALYFDARKRRLAARAMSAERWRALLEAAGPGLGLPAEPRLRPSMNMVVAVDELLGRKMPGWGYVKRFEPRGAGEEPQEIRSLNALLHDIAKRENAGMSYSLEELAALNNVPIDDARRALAIFRDAQQGEMAGPRVPGGLGGFEAPPPDVRASFRLLPGESPLFAVDKSAEVAAALCAEARERAKAAPAAGRRRRLRALLADGVVGARELPRLLEDEFFRMFDARDATVLSYTLYLLLRCGGEARRVSDYAAEIVKTFGQAFDEDARAELLPAFTRFCTHVLEPLCLVEVVDPPVGLEPADGSAPAPWMRAAPVLARWIRLGDYWEETSG